jgi:hypothetical protein
MEFKQFFEIFGMFNYVIPKDKEQQMYDFYMLSLLRGRTDSKLVNPMGYGEKPFYEPGNFEPGNLEGEEQQADYMLEEIVEKLLPYLKKEFLDVMSIAIAGEVKDSLYFNDADILEMLVKKENPNTSSGFSDFINELNIIMNPASMEAEYGTLASMGLDDELNPRDVMREFKIDISGVKVLTMVKKYFKSIEEFMYVAKTLFLKADWNQGYGGPKWAGVVDGYFKLNNAKTTNTLIVAIDHVYDLQHNNGSIFTKVKDYGKVSNGKRDFDWIKKALDYKRDLRSSKDLLNKVSPTMNKLASRIIHIKKIQ